MGSDILQRIADSVRQDLPRRRSQRSEASLRRDCEQGGAPAPRGFRRALEQDGIRIIAEVKAASPSKGRFPSPLEPVEQGLAYAAGGAACISVVTEPHFFAGSLATLETLRGRVALPLLRKDFIVDPYQIYEGRVAGADAILLIAALLEDAQLRALKAEAERVGLDVLVEVSDGAELERVLAAGFSLVGVNNRDLRDFSTDWRRSLELAPRMPPAVVAVSESGIENRQQIDRLREAGFRGFLIGEYLMRQQDPCQALQALCGAGASRTAAP